MNNSGLIAAFLTALSMWFTICWSNFSGEDREGEATPLPLHKHWCSRPPCWLLAVCFHAKRAWGSQRGHLGRNEAVRDLHNILIMIQNINYCLSEAYLTASVFQSPYCWQCFKDDPPEKQLLCHSWQTQRASRSQGLMSNLDTGQQRGSGWAVG